MSDASQARYSSGAMLFHWVIAVLVIVNWQLAEYAEPLEGAARTVYIGPHTAIGVSILVLTVLRLVWRLTHKPPPMPDSMASWERVLAKTVHVIFYVMLIGLPIGGWLAGSYAHIPVDYFGLFTIPTLPVEKNYEIAASIMDQHTTGGKVVLVLVALHVLGALKHTFFDKVGGIKRMLPGSGPA